MKCHKEKTDSVFLRCFLQFSFLLQFLLSLLLLLLLFFKQLSRRKSKDCAKLYATVCYTCSKRAGTINVGLVARQVRAAQSRLGQGRAGHGHGPMPVVSLAGCKGCSIGSLLGQPKAARGGQLEQLQFDMYPSLGAATSINKLLQGACFHFDCPQFFQFLLLLLLFAVRCMYTRFG